MLDFSFEHVFKFNALLEQKAESEGPKAKLTYAEDLIIEKGKEGVKYFNEQIIELIKNFQGLETDQMVNAKVDGSPGILFGADPRPQYQGQFFIGVNRSIIGAKAPKAVHDDHDLNTLIPNEGLRHVISNLLPYLKNLCAGTDFIYQADVIFSSPEQKREEEIDGELCLTFTPNLLTYAVPVEGRSKLYQKLKNAKVGFVVHDKCTGRTDETGQQIIPSSVGKDYTELMNAAAKSGDVFVDSSRHESVKFNLDKQSLSNLSAKVQKINSIVKMIDSDFDKEWVKSPVLKKYHTFIAHQVKRDDGGIFQLSKDKATPDFGKLIDELNKQVLDEYKMPSKREAVSAWLNVNHDNFQKLLEVFFEIRNVVDDVLDILYSMESKLGKTFVKLPDGSYQASRGEGFVLFKHQNHVKLVDRLDFTRSAKLYSKYNMPANVEESLIVESGNVFVPVQRIAKNDVATTVKWLESITGLSLVENMLGTTGKKETSGDLDLGVDSNKVSKDELVAKLHDWCIKNGVPEDKVYNTAKKKTQEAFKEGWIWKTGTIVHFKAPINGNAQNGFVQADFMFVPDLNWAKFSLAGSPHEGSSFKGADKHLFLNKLVKLSNPNKPMSWSYLNGLLDSETRQSISTNPNEIAKIVLGEGATANDLVSVESILQFIKKHHLEQKFGPAIDAFKQEYGHSDESINAHLKEGRIISFKELFNEEAQTVEVGFFPGAFKPLHTGHIKAIQKAASEVKGKLFVIVSNKSRSSEGGTEFDLEQTMKLFALYKDQLPENVIIAKAGITPLATVLQCLVILNNGRKFVLGKAPKNADPNQPPPDPESLVEPATRTIIDQIEPAARYNVILVVGDDEADVKRYNNAFKDERYVGRNVSAKMIQTIKGWSATDFRNYLEKQDAKNLPKYIPLDPKDPKFKQALAILYKQ
jgi:cytidyltransferase-like protein